MALTELAVKNAKGKATTYRLRDERNLYLQVTPSGGKYWIVRYWEEGKEKKTSLGPYPAISLKEARARRDELHTARAKGERISEVREQKTTEKRERFDVVAGEWLDARMSDKAPAYVSKVRLSGLTATFSRLWGTGGSPRSLPGRYCASAGRSKHPGPRRNGPESARCYRTGLPLRHRLGPCGERPYRRPRRGAGDEDAGALRHDHGAAGGRSADRILPGVPVPDHAVRAALFGAGFLPSGRGSPRGVEGDRPSFRALEDSARKDEDESPASRPALPAGAEGRRGAEGVDGAEPVALPFAAE